MTPELVAGEDLREILTQLNSPYYIQTETDGSYKVSLLIDSQVDTQFLTEKILSQIQSRNLDREEAEDWATDVRPLVDIEFISNQELQMFPHLKQYFLDQQHLPSAMREQLNSWFKRDVFQGKDRPPIVTFYSYKGGVGRSTTMAVVARLLAKEKFNIAVIDFDLEAPGQLSLLGGEQWSSRFGVTDYLIHKPHLGERLTKERIIKDYLVELPKIDSNDGSIHLMPAGGKYTEHYLEKLSSINFDRFMRMRKHPLDALFEDLQAALGNLDLIMIDARTGFADVAGTLLFKYSDLVSVHVYNNHQNKMGIQYLISQLRTLYDNPDDRMRMIWTHTAVPEWKYERDHEDLRIFLLQQLSSLYDGNNQDTNMVSEIDPAYLDLSLIPYYKELDGANRDHVINFIKKGADSYYHQLKGKIVNVIRREEFIPVDNMPVELSFESKRMILTEMNFGTSIAEKDNYGDFTGFSKNFLLLDGIQKLLDPETHLILGAKGVGKSALFRALRAYEQELSERLDMKNGKIITIEVTANTKFYHDKIFIKFDDLETLSKIAAKSDVREMLYWKRFWKLYLWLQIYGEMHVSSNSLNEIGLVTAEFKVEEWMHPLSFTENTLEQIDHWLRDRSRMDQIDKWLSMVDHVFYQNGAFLTCLYDHLDKLFEDNVSLQEAMINALLSFWDDGQFRNILPKILLRKDIYERLSIQNLSHWLSRTQEIVWSKNDLHRLILKRAIANSPTLKNHIEQHGKYYIDRDKFDEKLDIEIPHDEDSINRLIELIFGSQIGSGKKSGFMKNWFYNHLRDANDRIYPRDTIHLLSMAREEMLSHWENWKQEDRILGGNALANKEILAAVSEQRYIAVEEEYPHLKAFFRDFKSCEFTFQNTSFLDLISTLKEKNADRSFDEIEENLNTLIAIGVLKKYKTGNVSMPDLYLRGFNAKRPGPM